MGKRKITEIDRLVINNIIRLRKLKGLDRRELEEGAGIAYGILDQIETCHKPAGKSIQKRITGFFGIPEDDLYAKEALPVRLEEAHVYAVPELHGAADLRVEDETVDWEALEKGQVVARKEPEELRAINVYLTDVVRNPKDKLSRIPVETLFVPLRLAKLGPVAIKMEGNAMVPNIKDGAVIGLDYKDTKPTEGEVFVLRIPGGDVIVRRLFHAPNKVVLKADNLQFPQMELSPGALKIVGRVGWVLQDS